MLTPRSIFNATQRLNYLVYVLINKMDFVLHELAVVIKSSINWIQVLRHTYAALH